MKYILTEEQYVMCLLAGAASLNLMPPVSKIEGVEIDLVENGALIEVPDQPARRTRKQAEPVNPPAATPKPAVAAAKPAAAKGAKGAPKRTITPDDLRAGLVKLLARAPSVATIRTWTPEQIDQASAWVNLDGGGTRPAFIVEPKARKRRGAAAENGAAVDDDFDPLVEDDGLSETP